MMKVEREYLDVALEAWRGGALLRSRRDRYKRYTYGDQWSDVVETIDGGRVVEGELAMQSGKRPLTNNMIRQLVKCITGNFRSRMREESTSTMSDEVASRNLIDELDCRMLEEFLISGCAVQRVVTENRMGGSGVWVDNVSPARFFVNRFTDPRGSDIEVVGMLHDMSLREVVMRFASDSVGRGREIAEIYGNHGFALSDDELGTADDIDFFEAPRGRCRVIELWTLESRNIVKCHDHEDGRYFVVDASSMKQLKRMNAARRKSGKAEIETLRRTTVRWHCRYLAPTGEVLDEYDSPYHHGMHPFAVKFYPLTDGEVHSFVEDVIDQQRYINRLITMIDHIMGASAKGVLLFPMDKKPDNYTWEEIGELWTSCSGIIPYENRSGMPGEPKQIISGGEHSGAYKLLDIQMQLLQEISGVTGALQGRADGTRQSAALYDSQVRNSSVAILDIMESFNAFRRQRDRLVAEA